MSDFYFNIFSESASSATSVASVAAQPDSPIPRRKTPPTVRRPSTTPKNAVLPDAKRRRLSDVFDRPHDDSLAVLHREALVLEKQKLTSEIEKLDMEKNVLRLTISKLELELEVLRAKQFAQECDALGLLN